MKKSTIRYSDRAWELLEAVSAETGRPIASLVNEAIERYLGERQTASIVSRLEALEAYTKSLDEKIKAIESQRQTR